MVSCRQTLPSAQSARVSGRQVSDVYYSMIEQIKTKNCSTILELILILFQFKILSSFFSINLLFIRCSAWFDSYFYLLPVSQLLKKDNSTIREPTSQQIIMVKRVSFLIQASDCKRKDNVKVVQ